MKKSKKNIQIGLGASSVLMIFVVLCMMILSVLSYNHAQQNEKIAKREVSYEEDYQKADTLGEILYLHILKASVTANTFDDIVNTENVKTMLEENHITYVIDAMTLTMQLHVNKNQMLQIVLEKQGDTMIKNEWKLLSSGGKSL